MTAAGLLFFLFTLGAAAPPDGLKPCGEGIVSSVERGDRLTLEDGRLVRLAHLVAPGPGVGPGEDTARAALGALAKGHHVTLRCESLRGDRHGALVAHVFRDGDEDGWLQARLIAAGHAFAFLRPGERLSVPALFDLAEAARRDGRGVWASPSYQSRAETAEVMAGSFGRVEGRVHATGKGGGNVWLNFGADRSRDFTLEIPPRLAKQMTEAGTDPLTLAGRQVAATGFIDWRGGPHIALTHASQLVLMADSEAPKETRPGPGIREPSPAQE